MKTTGTFGRYLAAFTVLAVALLLMASAAYAQAQGGTAGGCGDGVCMNVISMVFCEGENCPVPESYENCPQDCPASCSDGFKNQGETGIDCGGSCALTVGCVGNCTSAYVVDYCDSKDNDKDCLVDEDCKPQLQPVTGVAPIKGPSSGGQQKAASCSDGIQNQDEVGVDCGGVCVIADGLGFCDDKDNDRDCQIDEAEECRRPQAAPQESVPVPVSMPEQQPVSEPVSGSATEPESLQTQPTPLAMPAEESPSSQPALAGSVFEPSHEDVTLQAGQIRQFAKNNSIYIPESEPDSELLKKYLEFGKKHEAELEAKFQGKELTEKDIAGVLKQFSEETYPKPVQQQSFFSKVAGFFKRIFS